MHIETVQHSVREDIEEIKTIRFRQGNFQQIVAASNCGIKATVTQQRWPLQKHSPILFHAPLDMLKQSRKLSPTNWPLFEEIQASAGGNKSIVEEEGCTMELEETQDLENYDPKKFVNRDDELTMIEERVKAFRQHEVVGQSLVNFWGMAGIGKTWLLKEIEYRYQYDPAVDSELQKPTCALYFDFGEHEQTITAVVHELTQSIANNLTQPLLNDKREKELFQLSQSKNIKDSIKFMLSLSSELVLIILLDTTEMVEDALWKELETKFLEPLLKSNKILLIGTGRNRAPRWKRVEVRRRATPIEKSQVEPFDQKATEKQLKNMGLSLNIAQELFDDSVGTPRLTTKLGRHRLRLPEQGYQKERVNEWNEYIEDIFEHLSQLPDSFREMITAVMPLRYYRTQALRIMLEGTATYSEDTSDLFLLRALRKLDKKSHLVWWDDHQNAYVTALAARRILNRRLQIENLTEFVNLHAFALDMYKGWARDYPASMPAYYPELLFHEATIHKSQNLEPDKKLVAKEFISMMDEMSIDNRDILQRRLKKDKELQTLIPKLYNKCLTHLEKSVGSVEG